MALILVLLLFRYESDIPYSFKIYKHNLLFFESNQ